MASLYDYDCLNEDDRGDNQNNKLPKTSSLDASDSFYDSLDDSWYDTADKDDDDENDIGGGPDSKRHSRHQHSIHHQQSASSSNPIHAGRELRPEGDVKETAQTRHRKRRYAVFSRLLASSAELLQLDKVHSMGLLPVLDKLLIPSANNRASRRRKSNRSTQSLPNESTNATNTSNNSGDNAAHSLPEALFLDKKMNQVEHLRPFLEGLGHGAGFRCVAMFLLLHLLHSPKGYDARVRQAIKSVGVIVLVHDAMLERQQSIIEEIQRQQHRTGRTFRESSGVHPGLDDGAKEQTSTEPTDFVALATRKFESLEQFVARKLVEISKGRNGDQNQGKKQEHVGSITSWGGGISSRDRIIRGLKIGGTAVAAGTLFAITGGLGKL